MVYGIIDIETWIGSNAPSVGQKTMENSIPVVLSSDQSAIPVTFTTPAGTTPILSLGDISLTDITTSPIRRTTYTEQTVNFFGSIKSSVGTDTSAGTGARTVRIYYLDEAGTASGTEEAILNGTTSVNLVNQKCFIEKMEVLTAGSNGVSAGIISLFTGLNGTGTLVGTISAGTTQTFWAHHYVISGKTSSITSVFHGNSSTVSSNNSYAVLRSKPIGITDAVETQISDFVAVAGASNPFNRAYASPIKVVGPARIIMYVTTGGSATNIYRGSFDSNE